MKRLKIPTPSGGDMVIDDRYKIVREIGQGAAGTVYEGVQLSVDRRVAVKILHRSNQSRSDYKERFSREAKAIARLSHTNCITLHDFGFSDKFESLYMVMEFVDGVELYELIKDEPLPFRRALKICIQIAEALAHAHRHGILHRDLKPENVLVSSDDEVKVLDFGLARMLDLFADEGGRRLTAEGAIFGTPAYMSPEQCGGDLDVTVHSDIYSLGIMMYQLFEGELPFDSKEVVKILMQQAKSPPPPLTAPIPTRLKLLIGRMLEKEKGKRPSTATEVADTLRAVLLGMAVDDGSIMPDVSQEIQRSFLSREFPALREEKSEERRTTEDGLPQSDRRRSESTPPVRIPSEELIGHRLGGQFAVESIVGRGEMSTVFAATDAADRKVAIKVLAHPVPDDLGVSGSFGEELEKLGQLDHPSIVGLRDVGHDEQFDRLYFVTEFLNGDDVFALCKAGRTSVEIALLVGQETCSAMAHAHAEGVLHRDLKPSDVMLCPRDDGTVMVKVLDFGLATLMEGLGLEAQPGPRTAAHMAPEEFRHGVPDERADIYALGVILYEMLAGHSPFQGKTRAEVEQAVLAGGVPPLGGLVQEVPEVLSDLIARMMSVDRARRPRSAIVLLEQFDTLQNTLGLKPFRVRHTGRSEDPASDWRLRRRVPVPVRDAGPRHVGARNTRSAGAPGGISPAQADLQRMRADQSGGYRRSSSPSGPHQIPSTGVSSNLSGQHALQSHPDLRNETIHDWQPSRRRSWIVVVIALIVVGAVVAGAMLIDRESFMGSTPDAPERTAPAPADEVDPPPSSVTDDETRRDEQKVAAEPESAEVEVPEKPTPEEPSPGPGEDDSRSDDNLDFIP